MDNCLETNETIFSALSESLPFDDENNNTVTSTFSESLLVEKVTTESSTALFIFLYYIAVMGSFFGMIGIAYFLQLLLKQWWKLRHFRSPFALPLVGNCYNPEAFTLFRYLSHLRKQFGTNFVIYLFTKPYLVTIDPHVVRRVLGDSKSFDNPSLSPHLAFQVFGEGLLFPHDNHHLKKAIILSYYSLTRVSKSVPALNDALSVAFIQLFEDKLLSAGTGTKEKENAAVKTKTSVNLESFFIRVALRSFLNYACGVDLRGDLSRENEVSEISFPRLLSLTSPPSSILSDL
jgi:hypothetical protein